LNYAREKTNNRNQFFKLIGYGLLVLSCCALAALRRNRSGGGRSRARIGEAVLALRDH
jgi:hypothetical protein